eukprot:1142768-Pelagomonas_calceolata.AAC.6
MVPKLCINLANASRDDLGWVLCGFKKLAIKGTSWEGGSWVGRAPGRDPNYPPNPPKAINI